MCHGAQTRPRGASLGLLSPPVPTGSIPMRQCDATARRSRDGACVSRLRTSQYGASGARGAVETKKNVPRSPDATQRRQFRSPITPIAHWAHSGAPMRRYGSPTARRRARLRATEHPKMAVRTASAARARGAAEAKKTVPHGAQTRPRGASLGPPPFSGPTRPTPVRQCDTTARRSRDGARGFAPPNIPIRRQRRARRRGGAKKCETRPRGASLGPPSTPLPTGPTLERQCDAITRQSRDGARVCVPPNTPK